MDLTPARAVDVEEPAQQLTCRGCFGGLRLSVGPEAAAEITNGKYHLARDEGPIVGHLRVEIYAADEVDYALDDPKAARHAGGELLPPNAVLARYNRASELKVLTSGSHKNQFNFELTGGSTRP